MGGIIDKIASAGIGDILDGVGGLAKDVRAAVTGELSQEQKTALEQRAKDLEQQAIEAKSRLTEAQRDIITAEAEGESWLQRNWRPLLMSIFGVIIANNYILNPYLSAIFSVDIMLDIPPDMWQLLKIGIGGYIASRGGEKGVSIWKGKRGK